jgi:integrase
MGGKRTLIAKGIYRDKSGIAIVVSVRGKPREFRKDEKGRAYSTFTKDQLLIERKRIDAREHLKGERAALAADTFAQDVARYLATISSASHRANSHGYLAHFVAAFGDRPRNTITDLDLQTAFAGIDRAASTKRHIRDAIIDFYETLNGKSGTNPGRELKRPPKDEEHARDLPYAWIEQILSALQPSRARARLMVLAYIGLPHKQIKGLQRSDLRLDAREVIVRPRRKGAGSAGRALQLSDFGIAALHEFIRVDAFGPFQNRQLANTFRHGAKLAGITLPDDARPYDLRHSFLSELARGGTDIKDIAYFGMHATLEQAARYTKGVTSERATKAIRDVPRFSATTNRKNLPKGSTSLQRTATRRTRSTATKRTRS